jgi:hypothetical protein
MRELRQPPQLFAADLPRYVSDAWRQAGNEVIDRHLYSAEPVPRILADRRLKDFWSAFDQLVSKTHEEGKLAGPLAAWLERERRNILFVLATKGGRRRKITTAAMKRQRLKIAKALDLVVDLMCKQDDAVRCLKVEDALFWTRPAGFDKESIEAARKKGTSFRSYFVGRHSQMSAEGPKLLTDAMPHASLIRLMNSVSYRLKSGRPLNWADDINEVPLVQPGRGDRAYLEHVLVRQFYHISKPLPADLFAPAIEVALDLPKGTVEANDLAERLRKIYKPHRRKSSAVKRKR